MSLHVKVPIRTAVIEANDDCTIGGRYEDGVLVIDIDTQRQDHYRRLNLPKGTRLYWGKT